MDTGRGCSEGVKRHDAAIGFICTYGAVAQLCEIYLPKCLRIQGLLPCKPTLLLLLLPLSLRPRLLWDMVTVVMLSSQNFKLEPQ